MKKLLLSAIAALGLVSTTYGDGSIFLTNYGSGAIADTPVTLNGNPATSFFVEILGGTSAGSLTPLVTFNTSSAVFTGGGVNGSGFFDGGFGVITGLADFGTGFFEVRAWSTGASYAAATVRGTSGVFSQATGKGPNGINAAQPVTLDIPGNTINLTLAAVPEPTTIALGVAGGLALLARRRRNA